MVKLIALFLIILNIAVIKPAEANIFKDVISSQGSWPWPWGSECPFPWEDISGSWMISELGEEIQFEVLSSTHQGERFLKITHLDRNGGTLAVGYGYGPAARKVITASMAYNVNGITYHYWLLIRAYSHKDQFASSCQATQRVTAITFRPVACECGTKDDTNLTLKKMIVP